MTTHLVHVIFFNHHPTVSTAQQEFLANSQRPEGRGHQPHNAAKLFRLDYGTVIGNKGPQVPIRGSLTAINIFSSIRVLQSPSFPYRREIYRREQPIKWEVQHHPPLLSNTDPHLGFTRNLTSHLIFFPSLPVSQLPPLERGSLTATAVCCQPCCTTAAFEAKG